MSLFRSNWWNRFRYRLWAPVYDPLVRMFSAYRSRSLSLAALQPGERVLLVGAGTGLDLEFFPPGLHVTATDLTPAMVERLRRRAARLRLAVDARVMDGQALEFPDGSFDVVILHLIVAVIPDPVRCLKEAARVLGPGGRAVVLDKFAPDTGPVPLPLRLLNPFFSIVGTEVTRRLGPLLEAAGLQVVQDEKRGLGGMFRMVLVRKPETQGH